MKSKGLAMNFWSFDHYTGEETTEIETTFNSIIITSKANGESFAYNSCSFWIIWIYVGSRCSNWVWKLVRMPHTTQQGDLNQLHLIPFNLYIFVARQRNSIWTKIPYVYTTKQNTRAHWIERTSASGIYKRVCVLYFHPSTISLSCDKDVRIEWY